MGGLSILSSYDMDLGPQQSQYFINIHVGSTIYKSVEVIVVAAAFLRDNK